MTRTLHLAVMLTLAAGSLFGQRGGSGRQYGQGNILSPGGVSNPGSFGRGNVLFPGGVTPPQPRLGTLYPNPNQGQSHGGFRGGRQRTVVVPYTAPVWVGGSYGGGYAGYDPMMGYSPNQPASNITVVIPQQPTPQVIFNPNYVPDTARPLMRDYSNTELPETGAVEPGGLRIYEAPTLGRGDEPARSTAPKPPTRTTQPPPARTEADDKPTIYLIALKDSTVRTAIGYWATDGTLNYVTPQGTINHVSLDMFDRTTTQQLNKQQGLEFDLSR